MARIIFSLVVLLAWCRAASAQQFGSYVYAVAGPVVVPRSDLTRWNGSFVYAGGGGEARFTDRFGLGGDVGVLNPVTNPFAITAGLAAVTPAYHFMSKDSNLKIDPFLNGGVSVLFTSGSVSLPPVHYGGGLNYRVRRNLGVRFEFRHHLWNPESGSTVHLVAFRAGIIIGH